MTKITENNIETFAIETLQSLGWEYANGKNISPEGVACERKTFEQIILTQKLRKAVARLNPDIPADALEQALREVQRINSPEFLPKLMSGEVRVEYENN